jgi:hypothetical protein
MGFRTDTNYENLRRVADAIENGDVRIDRLSLEEEQGRTKGGRRNVEASVILAGDRSANRGRAESDTRQEIIDRQEALLKKYAADNNLWIKEKDVAKQAVKQLESGYESRVYLGEDGYVTKFVNYRTLDNTVEGFIDNRISLYNHIFPENSYELIGFHEDDGKFEFVLKQQFMRGRHLDFNSDEDVKLLDAEMKKRGFDKLVPTVYKNDNYGLYDLKNGNVIISEEGNIFFIDVVPKLNTPKPLGGVREYGSGEILSERDINTAEAERAVEQFINELETPPRTRFQAMPDPPKPKPTVASRVADATKKAAKATVTAAKNAPDWTRKRLQDKYIIIRRLENELIKRGAKIDLSHSAYEKMDKISSIVQEKWDRLKKSHVLPMYEKTGAVMKAIMDKKGVSKQDAMDMIDEYLIAKHAAERNAHIRTNVDTTNNAGSGMTDAVAADIIAEIEKTVDAQKLKEMHDAIREMTNKTLRNMLEYGRLTKWQYDEYKNKYRYYIPLRGWKENELDAIEQHYVERGTGVRNGNSMVIQAKGRSEGSLSSTPLAYIMNDAYKALAWGENNNMLKEMYHIVVKNKAQEDLFHIETSWALEYDLVDKNGATVKKKQQKEYDVEPTQEDVDNLLKSTIGGLKVVITRRKKKRSSFKANLEAYKKNQHRVDAWIGGERSTIFFKQVDVANALNSLFEDQNQDWLQWSRAINRYLSTIFTSKNPAFMLPNTLRDFQQASQWVMIHDGVGMAGRVHKMMPFAIAQVWKNTVSDKKLQKTVNGRDEKGNDKVSSSQELYDEFLLSGALTGFTRSMNLEDRQREVAKMLKRAAKGKKSLEGGTWVGDFLDDMAQISENCTRLAIYVVSVRKPITIY